MQNITFFNVENNSDLVFFPGRFKTNNINNKYSNNLILELQCIHSSSIEYGQPYFESINTTYIYISL